MSYISDYEIFHQDVSGTQEWICVCGEKNEVSKKEIINAQQGFGDFSETIEVEIACNTCHQDSKLDISGNYTYKIDSKFSIKNIENKSFDSVTKIQLTPRCPDTIDMFSGTD